MALQSPNLRPKAKSPYLDACAYDITSRRTVKSLERNPKQTQQHHDQRGDDNSRQ